MKNSKIDNTDDVINLKDIAKSKTENLNNFFQDKKMGLTSIEVEQNLKKNGLNEIKEVKNQLVKDIFLEIISPFNMLLFFIAIFDFVEYIVSLSTNKVDSTYLISGILVVIMIILSTTVSLVIEYKTDGINKELKKLIKNNIHVIRDVKIDNVITKEKYSKLIKNISKINSTNLAIGDIVHLSTGDIIPANIRIIYEHHLLIDESSITGESDNIHKISSEILLFDDDLSYKNICYAGSTVISGFAVGVVFQRLNESFLNELVKKNEEDKKQKNSFQINLKTITKIILIMVLFTILIVFFISLARLWLTNNSDIVNDIFTSLVFAIAISVGLIPESLPVIISANLSRGSKNMANKKMLVKSNSIVQDIGLIQILCTDKTGTLTNNDILLSEHLSFSSDSNNKINFTDDDKIFRLTYFNSYYQTGLVNNTIDNAILKHGSIIKNINSYVKIDEIPFNFKRRILSVIIDDLENNEKEYMLISKGAFEEILKISTQCNLNDKVVNLSAEIKHQLKEKVKNLNNNGFRVVAVGYKYLDKKKDLFDHKDENKLILSGFLTFSDTPKEGIEEAIKIIDDYGIQLKIISGDTEKITKSICNRIGFKITNIITGNDLNQIPENEIYKKVINANVFVKISPLQKSKIIEILQKKYKVGFLGDGINDAIALKQSDVAISVDNATEIAKQSSDVILLEKNLKIIEDGLIQGRSTFANIVKFIKITLVNKFALMLTFIISSIWLRYQLMTPFEIIFLDLLLDFVQLSFILDNVNIDLVKNFKDYKLEKWYKFVLFNAPFIVIISLINFAIINVWYGNNPDVNAINQIHSIIFTEIGIISIFAIFVLRTKNNLFSKKETVPTNILLITLSLIAFILIIPYIPYFNEWMELKKFAGWWYLIMFGYIIIYWFIQEMGKIIYIKYFKTWI